jgi:hypothetical protein
MGNVSAQQVQGRFLDMKRNSIGVIVLVGVFLSALVAMAIAAKDKYYSACPTWARIL